MAKNEGLSALGGFGEAFFKTIQSERERQDKLNQQQQEFSQKSREMNLLNAYRNKMYELDQQRQAIDTEKTEYDIRGDYQEIPMMPNAPLFPILQGGEIGSEKNKDFNGVLNPFNEDKFYAPKQGKQSFDDLWEDINPNAIDPKTNKPAKLMRNKQTGEERYVENYREPKSSGSGNGEDNNKTGTPKQPDLSNEIDELEYWYRDYSGGNEGALNNLKSKSEALLSKAGLITEKDMIWNSYKQGLSYGDTVEAINNYRVQSDQPELADWQVDVIKRYYNARIPKAYK